jgi:hypothetical protein
MQQLAGAMRSLEGDTTREQQEAMGQAARATRQQERGAMRGCQQEMQQPAVSKR